MKRLLLCILLVASQSSSYGQAVYSEFEGGPELKRFTHISENLRCLCGCGLVLSTCPHVNCGFGIPARRLIEFMIEAGFTDKQIFDGFKRGLLSLENPKNFAPASTIAQDLKAYYSNTSFANDSSVVPAEAQRKERLFKYLIERKPEGKKIPRKGKPTIKLSRHLDLMIAKERAKIEAAEVAIASATGQLKNELERKKGEAYSVIYRLANFRLGYGSRVLATGESGTSNVLTALGLLLVALTVFFLIFGRKLIALKKGRASQPTTGAAAPPIVEDGDYDDQYKELDQ